MSCIVFRRRNSMYSIYLYKLLYWPYRTLYDFIKQIQNKSLSQYSFFKNSLFLLNQSVSKTIKQRPAIGNLLLVFPTKRIISYSPKLKPIRTNGKDNYYYKWNYVNYNLIVA